MGVFCLSRYVSMPLSSHLKLLCGQDRVSVLRGTVHAAACSSDISLERRISTFFEQIHEDTSTDMVNGSGCILLTNLQWQRMTTQGMDSFTFFRVGQSQVLVLLILVLGSPHVQSLMLNYRELSIIAAPCADCAPSPPPPTTNSNIRPTQYIIPQLMIVAFWYLPWCMQQKMAWQPITLYLESLPWSCHTVLIFGLHIFIFYCFHCLFLSCMHPSFLLLDCRSITSNNKAHLRLTFCYRTKSNNKSPLIHA